MTLDVAAIQTYISKSSGNSYSGMSASLSISEPADVTNAALTLSYSKVGIIGYLSVLKADASVAHYM